MRPQPMSCVDKKHPIRNEALSHPDVISEVLRLFHDHGHSQYGGEAVSQLEHALQTAFFAERVNADSTLISAALLHDVGHLLHALPDDAPDQGIDDEHETLAARWLAARVGPRVVEPVRLHVAAKRFLCATEPDYLRQLSPPSALSLRLQGGPMSEAEVHAFRSHPYFGAAVALRHWDDAAKVPKLVTPPLEHYANYLDQVLRDHSQKEPV
jgi:[1-hydroxy-2-(trimethylamino)ethyl]phosphonate dioxygenase